MPKKEPLTPEYRAWINIRKRCRCQGQYASRYLLRGIKVCERWNVFANFLADMGIRPSPMHSIDRINNDGGYEPSNCKWSTAIEQSNNRRSNVFIELDGKNLTMSQWAREKGMSRKTIYDRMSRGWSGQDAVRGYKITCA